MKRYVFLIFIPSLLLFFLTVGCFPSHSRKTHSKSNIVGVAVDGQNVSVEIREKFDKKGDVIERGFNHPYNFIESGLANILSFVYYKRGKDTTDKKEEMVFREEELQNIIPPIISAFSTANESQDILVFSRPHYDNLENTRSYFSMFMTNNELNIVFSAINRKKSWLTDGRAIQMDTYYRDCNKRRFKDPLGVKRSTHWSLVPMEGQRLASGRENWLIIDFTYYGHSNLFGKAGSDNSIETNSSVMAIERKTRINENVTEEKKAILE